MISACNSSYGTQLLRNKPVDENTHEIWIRGVDVHNKKLLVLGIVEPDGKFCYVCTIDNGEQPTFGFLKMEKLNPTPSKSKMKDAQEKLLDAPSIKAQILEAEEKMKMAMNLPPFFGLPPSSPFSSPLSSPLSSPRGGNNNNNILAASGGSPSGSGFGGGVPAVAADTASMKKHAQWLISVAKGAEVTTYDKHCAGGILAVVKDPQTKQTYFLLWARNREYIDPTWTQAKKEERKKELLTKPKSDVVLEYCTVHGWVDKGETPAQGVAREAWEESLDLISSHFDLERCDIWRACVMSQFHLVLHTKSGCPTFLMYLGEMDEMARGAFEKKFLDLHNQPGRTQSSDEMESMGFFESKQFRDDCINSSEGVIKTCLQGKATGKLRDFLLTHFKHKSYWSENPILLDVVENGNVPLLPLNQLPQLDAKTKACLPFKKEITIAHALEELKKI